MRWNARDHSQWRLVFAWFPVRVDNQWVWLEDVYTRVSGVGIYRQRHYRLFDDGSPEPPRESL
jgi:hypothetical protein